MSKEPTKVVNALGENAKATEVLQEVVQLTGLPESYLDSEISELLGTTSTSVNDLSLDQLRAALLNYLETVNEEINAELGREANLSEDSH